MLLKWAHKSSYSAIAVSALREAGCMCECKCHQQPIAMGFIRHFNPSYIHLTPSHFRFAKGARHRFCTVRRSCLGAHGAETIAANIGTTNGVKAEDVDDI